MVEYALTESFLIVDDDEILRIHLSRAITSRGYSVVSAESGDEAVRLLHDFQPDKAVCDLKMPGMTGLEFLKQIRVCLLYTSPSPRDQRGSRMPSSA